MADMSDTRLAFTSRQEGGYVDDPADPGGATNMGITLATYREWSDDPHVGDVQVRDMALKTARAIYRSLFWNRSGPTRFRGASTSVHSTCVSMPASAGRPDYCSKRSASLKRKWTG
jgi:lysozyme family protein